MRVTVIALLCAVALLTACGTSTPTGQVSGHDHDSHDHHREKNVETEDSHQIKTGVVKNTSSVKEIRMTAEQFYFEPSTIHVQKGKTLRLNITATDVPHGFAINQFGIDKRLPVGKSVLIEFTPDNTGSYRFYCSVYCGKGHGSMTGTLVVE